MHGKKATGHNLPKEKKGATMLQPTFTITPVIDEGNYARLSIEPLEKGYGHTLGVSLRRVLLTSIEGAAVTKVVVNGVHHQFTTLEGMEEDVVDLILNIKELHFMIQSEGTDEITVSLSAKGPKTVTGADITLQPGVTLANPEQHLAILAEKKNELSVEMTITRGRGYRLAAEETAPKLGEIPVDASFSPVSRVAYKIEATRVGRRTDFDNLIMDIWTTGAIKPQEALEKAARILVDHFKQVYEPVLSQVAAAPVLSASIEDEVFRLTVEELELPTRIANALRKGGYKSVKELTQANHQEIAKVKNLGEKSVDTVREALQKKGVDLISE